MTAVAWILVVVAMGVGLGAGLWAGRANGRSRATGNTLVPARTRQLLAVFPAGAVVIRRDRRSAYCNNAALALGVARPDGALHPELARLAEIAWNHNEVIEEDIEVQRGVLASSRTLQARVAVVDDELVLALIADRTEQQAAEQMRRNFAINVSHELKTPVGAIQLLAESVEAGADDPDMVLAFTKKLRKEAKRLSTLIQEIIEITRLQSDAAVMDAAPVRLGHVVEEAVEGTATAASARTISVTTDIKEDVTILGNEELLVMAVRNLLENAIQYSDPGKRIIVSAEVDGEVASVSVVDQGIGIAPAETERIFERFYRVDPARSRETGGTGLGLSIVKHIALRHDGKVEVWSTPGVGSTFTLKLPVSGQEEDHE
ncbi:sensor histidine kinase [Demequina sp.]|uniref:sensor histidine kinase n=1 Tax=Demequina sp. TaxID=2050685 RepID=UPI003D0CF7D0